MLVVETIARMRQDSILNTWCDRRSPMRNNNSIPKRLSALAKAAIVFALCTAPALADTLGRVGDWAF